MANSDEIRDEGMDRRPVCELTDEELAEALLLRCTVGAAIAVRDNPEAAKLGQVGGTASLLAIAFARGIEKGARELHLKRGAKVAERQVISCFSALLELPRALPAMVQHGLNTEFPRIKAAMEDDAAESMPAPISGAIN